MEPFATEIETNLVDLSEVSLDRLRTLNDPALTKSITRLLAEVEQPSANLGDHNS